MGFAKALEEKKKKSGRTQTDSSPISQIFAIIKILRDLNISNW